MFRDWPQTHINRMQPGDHTFLEYVQLRVNLSLQGLSAIVKVGKITLHVQHFPHLNLTVISN